MWESASAAAWGYVCELSSCPGDKRTRKHNTAQREACNSGRGGFPGPGVPYQQRAGPAAWMACSRAEARTPLNPAEGPALDRTRSRLSCTTDPAQHSTMAPLTADPGVLCESQLPGDPPASCHCSGVRAGVGGGAWAQGQGRDLHLRPAGPELPREAN